MAVITYPKDTKVAIKFDCGPNFDGKNEYITKVYSGISKEATNEKIMEFVNTIVSLQEHDLDSTNRKDFTILSN